MVYHPLRGLLKSVCLAHPALTHGTRSLSLQSRLKLYDYFFNEHQAEALWFIRFCLKAGLVTLFLSSGGATTFACLALCRLGQSSVQMGVAAVNKQVLTGDVAGLFRDQKDHHRGDLFGASHAFSQRHF
jgi:hypothetical protein